MDFNRTEGYGTDSTGSGYEPLVGSCEHGNELWGANKCWELLHKHNNYSVLKNDSTPLSQLLAVRASKR
jgi:hypothetical protein